MAWLSHRASGALDHASQLISVHPRVSPEPGALAKPRKAAALPFDASLGLAECRSSGTGRQQRIPPVLTSPRFSGLCLALPQSPSGEHSAALAPSSCVRRLSRVVQVFQTRHLSRGSGLSGLARESRPRNSKATARCFRPMVDLGAPPKRRRCATSSKSFARKCHLRGPLSPFSRPPSQCDTSTGIIIWCSRVRLTPPNITSASLECP